PPWDGYLPPWQLGDTAGVRDNNAGIRLSQRSNCRHRETRAAPGRASADLAAVLNFEALGANVGRFLFAETEVGEADSEVASQDFRAVWARREGVSQEVWGE